MLNAFLENEEVFVVEADFKLSYLLAFSVSFLPFSLIYTANTQTIEFVAAFFSL